MYSLNYKCISAKRPEATHLPATKWSGFVDGTSLNCADYSELKVAFRILVCITSFPFFATAKHYHLSYRNQICHLQIASDSFPHLTETARFLIIFLTPPQCFQHCTFLPLTPGRTLTYNLPPKLQQQPPAAQHLPRPRLPKRKTFLHSWVLWTLLSEMLGEDYFYSPVIPTPAFLLKKLVLPSALNTAIWPYTWDCSPFLLHLWSDP